MEASGPYYLQLTSYLYFEGFEVVVENPLAIKRYSQMELRRVKTDKKYVQTICIAYCRAKPVKFTTSFARPQLLFSTHVTENIPGGQCPNERPQKKFPYSFC